MKKNSEQLKNNAYGEDKIKRLKNIFTKVHVQIIK